MRLLSATVIAQPAELWRRKHVRLNLQACPPIKVRQADLAVGETAG